VGGFIVAVQRSGKDSNSEAIKPWSLCKVHEALIERYWPVQQSQHDRNEDPNAAEPIATSDRGGL
jgi:hypothetical protein